MRLGALRKRLTLQSESFVADGSGGNMAEWATVAVLWGEILPLSSTGALSAQSDRRPTHNIRIRCCPALGVTTGMRLVDGSRIFSIRSIVNADERNRWLDLLTEEGGLLE